MAPLGCALAARGGARRQRKTRRRGYAAACGALRAPCFSIVLAKRSLRFNLAYSEGFESLGLIQAEAIFERLPRRAPRTWRESWRALRFSLPRFAFLFSPWYTPRRRRSLPEAERFLEALAAR